MSSPNQSAQRQQLQPQPNLSHHQQQQITQSSPISNHQFRSISRNNSNTSTASSSNKGEFSSTISTTNSITSSRSQLSRPHQLIDHRQLLATCGSSTPIRSFQRATISSVVKTRAFDNNPVLQGLLATASPSNQNSASNSQTPSPLSTPVFSRSRSLRMSGGPGRYQQSPTHHFRTTSRTPEIYSFNHSGDNNSYSHESRILELNSEKSELKESLEFLETERQVLIDSAIELKDILQKERASWKKEQDELKKQITDSIAARCKAESQLTKLDMEINDIRTQFRNLNDELQAKNRQIESMKQTIDKAHNDIRELHLLNDELKKMLTEKLRFNGLNSSVQSNNEQRDSDCMSIVTEMARLRLELNEKNKILERHNGFDQNIYDSAISANHHSSNRTTTTTTTTTNNNTTATALDVESLNKFLDQTVECIKGWPEELASSSHVQNLMKTLLSAYKVDQVDYDLTSRFDNIHL